MSTSLYTELFQEVILKEHLVDLNSRTYYHFESYFGGIRVSHFGIHKTNEAK